MKSPLINGDINIQHTVILRLGEKASNVEAKQQNENELEKPQDSKPVCAYRAMCLHPEC